MASPYGKDIFTQAYQSRPPNFQPGPTNQDPNYAQSSAQSNFIDPPPPYQPASRPHSIAELAEISKQSLGDEARPFKTWLRIAENARRDAKAFREQGNLELAFVEYAKAAAIVLERVPLHPEYRVLLSPTQRHNMGLHGQEILDSLAEIKITIMRRYEQWQANPSSVQVQFQLPPASNSNPQLDVWGDPMHR